MSPRLAFALEAAHQAGRSTLALFQAGAEVESKADSSPVTQADKGAEAMLRRAIERAYPGETVLGEEEGLSGDSADRWVIDPIDGTKSFISGVPLYATLLSYEVDAIPVIGIAYFPALGDMIYAEAGAGAFCNGRPIRVRPCPDPARATVCLGSPGSFRTHGHWEGLARLVDQVFITRTWGDAYGHAMVATGRADAMAEPVVNRWDVSALDLIVREAGGKFTDLVGVPGIGASAISASPEMADLVAACFRG